MKPAAKTNRPSAAKPARKKAAGSPRGSMTSQEIRPLIMAARRAYDCQSQAGLVDDDFNTWRHDQVMAICGKPGLTACHHGDYRPLMAHFKTLSGDDAGAFRDLMRTGPSSDHSAPGDTHESRRQIANHIAQAISAHLKAGGKIGVGYLIYVTRQKTRRPDLSLGQDWQAGLADRCTVTQLEQIRNTIINRIAAAEGRGDTSTRNKSQRQKPARDF